MRKIPEADKNPLTRSMETTVMYLRMLVEAKDELLVCYRVGKRPTEKVMRKLDALREVEGLTDSATPPIELDAEVQRLRRGIAFALDNDDMTETLNKLLDGWDF